ncbi:E3 SUMO-protein ligase ZBED1-like [Anthonomus grandis grandis]|uniref:E3 SUMO-protein ligase ZBED1-like n=1 Tax=Anthonomus grandis grandis TaxID=2921223 RepID=UPI0021660E1F|nr:E3 SUMO-protein ligase ZBED1-like [Anthonomus grandis grandis]
MVALDFQPFNIVNDIGFNKFVNLLDPRYVLPSSFTLSGKMLNEFYLEMYQKVKAELEKIEYVAITCDSWTSTATESYLTVTCHYINTYYELKTAILSTKPLTGGINHTAENIAQTLTEIFEKWNIENKVMCIVTDNAANMIKSCELLKKKHLPCYALILNLAVQENFVVIQPVIKKCKDVVTFFKSSTIAMDMFKKEQNIDANNEGHKEYKLIQEVTTRWDSTYHMLERILKTNDAIGRAILKLRKAPVPLSVDEITLIQDCVKILKCFEEATRKVSGKIIHLGIVHVVLKYVFGIGKFKGYLNAPPILLEVLIILIDQ